MQYQFELPNYSCSEFQLYQRVQTLSPAWQRDNSEYSAHLDCIQQVGTPRARTLQSR